VIGIFRKLRRREEGTTLVEFAMIAPVLFLLITGFMELAYVLFARSTLESAVMAAARSARVADCPAENAKVVEKMIQDRMTVISSADGQAAVVTVESYGQNFGDVGNPEPFDDANGNNERDAGESYTDVNGNGQWDKDMGATGAFGQFGEVVRFTASYNVTSLVPFVAAQINEGKNFYPIQAVTVVRNEPFREVTCAL
jgi:Flp pilus assembly protein TadG